jgi:hypothetical protein
LALVDMWGSDCKLQAFQQAHAARPRDVDVELRNLRKRWTGPNTMEAGDRSEGPFVEERPPRLGRSCV